MTKPTLVRDIVRAIRSKVTIPVTVKCRIGVDCKSKFPQLTSSSR